jgi:hypothetical protein
MLPRKLTLKRRKAAESIKRLGDVEQKRITPEPPIPARDKRFDPGRRDGWYPERGIDTT